MTWGYVAVGAATLISGKMASDSAEDAADSATGASAAAVDESRRQFDLVRGDSKVARETGNDALMQLGYLLGVRQAPSAANVASLEKKLDGAINLRKKTKGSERTSQDLENIERMRTQLAESKKMQGIAKQYPGGVGDFIKSQPGYEFGLDQGNTALTNTLAAGGQSQGGKAMKAAERYGIDYAGSKTDEHLSRLFTLAGYGPVGVNQSANAGQNLANAAAGHAGVVGDAAFGEASANIGAVNNALNTGVSLWSYNNMLNRGSTAPRTNLTTVPQGTPNPNIGATA